ncbi:GLUG motif-containing protein [Natronolimnohabitans sp. A-GB9]|uniref:GLUG motif-containing protein n=1 Tax=Natronolimnohabitans sp. A-GB9 TaxID=3069757 RepID=UPI0027AEEEFE|nr:GLUG motif-containing protein [Natronolimnohabitans sp. A-GB9]MDQ2050203.1 GLUG motif-containing protein [Natronolimnohabitans sp. A-GB9]
MTDTLGFSRTEVNRITDISAVEDEDAYLALEGIDELGDDVDDCGVVNEFTITNQLGENADVVLSSDVFEFDPDVFDLEVGESETVTVSVDEGETGEIEIEAITEPASIEATVMREAELEDWSTPTEEEPDDYDDLLNDMDGDGTEDDPYVITDDQELQAIAGELGAHYELGRNIDASETDQWNNGAGFDPIGDRNNPFTGSFDGNGYEICGITIDRNDDGVGMFGTIDGVLENVTVTHVDVTGNGNVGALVGETGLSGEGMVDAEVIGADATGSVTGQYSVGGLVGYNHDSRPVEDSSAAVDVDGDVEFVGGLVGYNSGEVISSHAAGMVEGPNDVGGLVGHNFESGVVSGSYATGEVTADHTVGGLVGFNEGGVSDSHAESDVTANDVHPDDEYSAAGGLVGHNTGEEDVGTVTDSHVTGDATIVGETVVGGLVGLNFEGDDDVGVVVGSHVTTGVTVEGFDQEESAVGGLVGSNGDGSVITESYAECEVIGEQFVGGLVGTNLAAGTGLLGLGGDDPGEILESFATGDVTGDDNVGGLVGSNGGIVEDAYARGDVTGDKWVGGLAGINLSEGSFLGLIGGDEEGEIYRTYATGEVTGDDIVGGLVGENEEGGFLESDGVLEDSYWDTESTTQDDGVGEATNDEEIEGLETDEMQGSEAKDNMGEFDFDDVWRTVEDPDDYPELQWQDP